MGVGSFDVPRILNHMFISWWNLLAYFGNSWNSTAYWPFCCLSSHSHILALWAETSRSQFFCLLKSVSYIFVVNNKTGTTMPKVPVPSLECDGYKIIMRLLMIDNYVVFFFNYFIFKPNFSLRLKSKWSCSTFWRSSRVNRRQLTQNTSF